MKRERIDYAKEIGKKYGRLEIKEFIFEKGKKTLAVCKCECGGEKTTQYTNLKIGKTVSCGCVNNESRHSKENKCRTHGMTNTKIYHVWQGIIGRCYYEKNPSYRNYGGRGIKICAEWIAPEIGFKNFYKWAIENGYNDAVDKNGRALYSIDRIDVNGDYAPANCRWVTQEVQSYNIYYDIIQIGGNLWMGKKCLQCYTTIRWGKTSALKSYTPRKRTITYYVIECMETLMKMNCVAV